eukprot:g16633.t1
MLHIKHAQKSENRLNRNQDYSGGWEEALFAVHPSIGYIIYVKHSIFLNVPEVEMAVWPGVAKNWQKPANCSKQHPIPGSESLDPLRSSALIIIMGKPKVWFPAKPLDYKQQLKSEAPEGPFPEVRSSTERHEDVLRILSYNLRATTSLSLQIYVQLQP